MNKNKNNVPAVAINSEHITDDLNISDVKDRYNGFMERSKQYADEISDYVNVKEMKDIETLINDFNDRLEGVVKPEPQSDMEKSVNKTVTKLSMIPFIGKFLEGEAEDAKEKEKNSRTAKEILKEMFEAFNEKSGVLERSFENALKLRDILLNKEQELEVFSIQVKHIILTTNNQMDKVVAIRLGGLVESNKLKNKEKIYNKLDFILQFIEEQLTTIALMMPGIESSLAEDAEIGTYLSSVSDMNQVFKSLSSLSNSVARSGSEKVMKMITEVNSSMTDTVDVNHIEQLASNNKAFMNEMIKTTEKKIKNDAKVYGKLMDIGAGLDQNVIAYNESNKKVLADSASYMKHVETAIEDSIDAEIVNEEPVVGNPTQKQSEKVAE